jgi:hypothetical protein
VTAEGEDLGSAANPCSFSAPLYCRFPKFHILSFAKRKTYPATGIGPDFYPVEIEKLRQPPFSGPMRFLPLAMGSVVRFNPQEKLSQMVNSVNQVNWLPQVQGESKECPQIRLDGGSGVCISLDI